MAEKPRTHPSRLGDSATLTLPGWRRGVFPLACAVVVASGFGLMSGEEPRLETGAAMVGIGIVAGALFLLATNVLNRLQVHLDRDGLTVAKLWTVRRYGWDEVSEFSVSGRGTARGAKLAYVVFDADRGTGIGRAMNRFLTGKTQILPVGLVFEDGSGDAIIIADVLNAWRERARKHAQRRAPKV
ncbi:MULTISPECIES: hypothetical protein [Thalassobaculum]|uniref:PH domain-containing protein n=1 Tax=Thalassobaculum litoreum DSM 18839 TaxID=1123362 RepID=A0A8G2BG56_9PROT|nr:MULTISPECIES: hypothetical protein [Thalassobaculum]SDF11225.1 hypothetical protein SAMN05660686_00304 [Thalassobaculum litoreum DSM 18839]